MNTSRRVEFVEGDTVLRRRFVKTCLGSVTLVATNPSALLAATTLKPYARSLLTDNNGLPVTSASIKYNQAYIFHYPYVTTPCFLLNLGQTLKGGLPLQTDQGDRYTWSGGAGESRSIVAFSAICSHKLSYPTRSLSFLNYRPGSTQIVDQHQNVEQHQQVIYCCSERSVYDPSRGAEVLSGPAPQPLTAIEIEYDVDTDNYYAVGTRGVEMYELFFEKFGFRLALDHKISDIRTEVGASTEVYQHSDYSQHAVSC